MRQRTPTHPALRAAGGSAGHRVAGGARPTPGTRPSWGLFAGTLPAVALACLLIASWGTAAGRAPSAPPKLVLELYQSTNTTEQENFTVSMQLSDTTDVSVVYFMFCQLSSPLCYLPVTMTAHAGGWFVGTTHPMTSYHGMTPGVRAGFNITIEYANNSTVTEPQIPNAFGNLTVAQSVTGEYMYQMTVRNQTYALQGVVTDAATGAGIAGATVTLNPGNTTTTTGASGNYAFSNVPNGTYTVSVSDKGYKIGSQSVAISGQSSVKDVALVNATGSGPIVRITGGGSSGFFSNPVLEAALGIGVVVVVAVALLLFSRSRKASSAPTPSSRNFDPSREPSPPEKSP